VAGYPSVRSTVRPTDVRTLSTRDGPSRISSVETDVTKARRLARLGNDDAQKGPIALLAACVCVCVGVQEAVLEVLNTGMGEEEHTTHIAQARVELDGMEQGVAQ